MSSPRLVWRPDPLRYGNDPAYRDLVAELVASFLPGGSASTVRVLESDGQLAIASECFTDENGDWFRDPYGNVIQRTRFAVLAEGVELP